MVKLSQGEFVAISKLEAFYSHSPDIRQIYIYGTSERAFLIAVIVPSAELAARVETEARGVKQTLRRALQQIAEAQQLNGYEVPRDFILETEPFSLKNGLLSEVGKHQRPKLRAHYGDALEALYAKLAKEQIDEVRALRQSGREQPVLETVRRALQATLGLTADDIDPRSAFGELGGDSLSALSLSLLLEEVFGVEVPVGVIVNPAGNVRLIVDYIDAQRASGVKRASFASVHKSDATRAHASDLKLARFIDADILAKASTLPLASETVRTVLLTGATGFLGRFQALALLEKLAPIGGKLILLSRGADQAQARQRIEQALESDADLAGRFKELAAKHLEVLPGDLGLPNLGIDDATWARLGENVDLIVHTGAHVNHVLPYTQLFTANVAGTAELIRLALTTKLKRFDYISTLGVVALGGKLIDEDGDIRAQIPSVDLNDSYANGYGASKWASEVLLREANDLCALPVSVFRPGMILAHTRYAGQLNVPDMFTRLLYSLAVTGVAPATFYAESLDAGRPRGRYEGFTVDFLAEIITDIGLRDAKGFHSYNLAAQSGDNSASLDDFVDWMIEDGCAIERIPSYSAWLARFETAMNALPETQRQQSMLAILGPYRRPQQTGSEMSLPAQRFSDACAASGREMPNVSAAVIRKYVSDLRGLKLL